MPTSSDETEPCDEEFVRRIRAGDAEAARLLFDRHLPELRVKARAQLPDVLRGKLGESDVIQDAYLAAFLTLPEFEDRGDGSFRRWLRGILDHKLADAERRHLGTEKRDARREVHLPTQSGGGGLPTPQRTPSSVLAGTEESAAVRREVAQLPADQGAVVRFVHDEGLTLVEAARRLDRSPDATRKLYARALARLGERLAPRSGASG